MARKKIISISPSASSPSSSKSVKPVLSFKTKAKINAETETPVLRRTGRTKVNASAYLETETEEKASKVSDSDSDTDTDTDSKENETDEDFVKKEVHPFFQKKVRTKANTSANVPEDYKKLFGLDEVKESGEEEEGLSGIMLELNRYYPFPMNSTEPENRDLLFLKSCYCTSYGSDDSKHTHLKVFVKNQVKYVYLINDPELLQELNEIGFCPYMDHMLRDYGKNRIREGYLRNEQPQYKLSDTFDYPEAPIPEGFSLKLRDYQLRSISWMRSVESVDLIDGNRINQNVTLETQNQTYKTCVKGSRTTPIKAKLGDSGFYWNLMDSTISKSPATTPVKPFRVRGGILADDTGTGKTITCLALIHSFPMTKELAQWRLKSLNISLPNYIPSRASCVICPSNLYSQWIKEAKRCNPNFKVVGLSCIRDHEKVSWRDVMMGDIVVVSYQFLTNTNYIKFLNENRETSHNISVNLDTLIDVKGKVDLRFINFHRVFFDEIHEMSHKNVKCKEMTAGFNADFYWGITGTPPTFEKTITPYTCYPKKNKLNEETGCIDDLFPYLNFTKEETECLSSNLMAKEEFLKKFVKRNVPDLKLPKISTEIIWVTATPSELAIMNMMTNRDHLRDRIMMCCHYQICDKITNIVGDHFKSIDEVKKMLFDATLKELGRIKTVLNEKSERMKLLIAERQAAETAALKQTATLRIENHQKAIDETTASYKLCESKCKYFKAVFESMKSTEGTNTEDDESNECLICRDQIQPDSKSILPCAHIYCFECIAEAVKRKQVCPLCQKPIQPSKDILRIRPAPEPEIKDHKALSVVDTSKYGSKLIALYTYITELIRVDSNARIILFLQYRNLTEFISKTLDELNIKHVRVAGNVFQRKNSIESFKTSASNRVIILSSEDSVSGINLTEATHVLLLHPFWTGKGEDVDLAFEKQGICRAYRGGLDHPLKVVRFAVRNTIDEEFTNRRLKFH